MKGALQFSEKGQEEGLVKKTKKMRWDGPRSLMGLLGVRATAILALVCITLFTWHGYIVQKHAVNIPYLDDWAMFEGDNHPASVDLAWLNAQHNEHRMVPAKVLIWLQFQLNNWNYPVSVLINFLIYGILLVCMIWFTLRLRAPVPPWAVLAFVVFLLSPINWLNHVMALQSTFHFYVLFLLLSCALLFEQRQRWPELVLASLTAIVCIYSLAGGFVSVSALLVFFVCFKLIRALKFTRGALKNELLQMLVCVVVVGSALVFWSIGYRKPPSHPALVYPTQIDFWLLFINLISLAFGFLRTSHVIGLVCFLIVVFPICGEVWRSRKNLSSVRWGAIAFVLGIFANVAATSAGRAGFGVETAKADRYFEFVMPLVLLSVVNWSIFLRDRPKWKTSALVGLWLICAFGFSTKWNFANYRLTEAKKRAGVACVKAYYRHEGDGRCPTIFPYSLVPFLEQGKRVNASFYQELESDGP